MEKKEKKAERAAFHWIVCWTGIACAFILWLQVVREVLPVHLYASAETCETFCLDFKGYTWKSINRSFFVVFNNMILEDILVDIFQWGIYCIYLLYSKGVFLEPWYGWVGAFGLFNLPTAETKTLVEVLTLLAHCAILSYTICFSNFNHTH